MSQGLVMSAPLLSQNHVAERPDETIRHPQPLSEVSLAVPKTESQGDGPSSGALSWEFVVSKNMGKNMAQRLPDESDAIACPLKINSKLEMHVSRRCHRLSVSQSSSRDDEDLGLYGGSARVEREGVAGFCDSDTHEVAPEKIAAVLPSDDAVQVPPMTPSCLTSNVGRRRARTVSLERTTTSPSHLVKMAQIYHVARTSMNATRSSPGPYASNVTRLRILMAEPMQNDNQPGYASTIEVDLPRDGASESGLCMTDATDEQTPSESCYLPSYEDHSVGASPVGMVSRGLTALEPISSGFTSLLASPCSASLDNGDPGMCPPVHGQSAEKRAAQDSNTSQSEGGNDDDDEEDLYLVFNGIPLPGPMTEEELFDPTNEQKSQPGDAWFDSIFVDEEERNREVGRRTRAKKTNRKVPSSSRVVRDEDNSMAEANERACQSGDRSRSPQDMDWRPRRDSNKENQRPAELGSWGFDLDIRPPPRKVRLGADPLRSGLGDETHPFSSNVSASRFQSMKRSDENILPITRHKTRERTDHTKPRSAAKADLSPDVDVYRKSHRPKRERCLSYYDEDVLSPVTGCQSNTGQKILGESSSHVHLTKPQPFCPEAEAFHFTGI